MLRVYLDLREDGWADHSRYQRRLAFQTGVREKRMWKAAWHNEAMYPAGLYYTLGGGVENDS